MNDQGYTKEDGFNPTADNSGIMDTSEPRIVDERTGEVLCEVGDVLSERAARYVQEHVVGPDYIAVRNDMPPVNWNTRMALLHQIYEILAEDSEELPENFAHIARVCVVKEFDKNGFSNFCPGQIGLCCLYQENDYPFKFRATIYTITTVGTVIVGTAELKDIVLLP